MHWKLKFWAEQAQKELDCFHNVEETIAKADALNNLGLLRIVELEDKGMACVMIENDFRGIKTCMELFFYIKKEHRGNPRNFFKLLRKMEEVGKAAGCKQFTFGSNIGYRDQKLLGILIKQGFVVDTVKKEL